MTGSFLITIFSGLTPETCKLISNLISAISFFLCSSDFVFLKIWIFFLISFSTSIFCNNLNIASGPDWKTIRWENLANIFLKSFSKIVDQTSKSAIIDFILLNSFSRESLLSVNNFSNSLLFFCDSFHLSGPVFFSSSDL